LLFPLIRFPSRRDNRDGDVVGDVAEGDMDDAMLGKDEECRPAVSALLPELRIRCKVLLEI
jgi:hypothetical protein